MKILNILVNHTVEPLRSHIVRYLLDAGHFVYLIGLSDAERTRWTGSQHNLFCYSDVGDQRIDYERRLRAHRPVSRFRRSTKCVVPDSC